MFKTDVCKETKNTDSEIVIFPSAYEFCLVPWFSLYPTQSIGGTYKLGLSLCLSIYPYFL